MKKEIEEAKKEAVFLKNLNHPNIVKHVEEFVSKDKKSLCIVMELAMCKDNQA